MRMMMIVKMRTGLYLGRVSSAAQPLEGRDELPLLDGGGS